MKKILSLGAGVQSTAMALMFNENPRIKPDLAIFADTGEELKETYDMISYIEKKVPYPIYKLKPKKKLSEEMNREDRHLSIPFFLEGKGKASRQCTYDMKIKPIRKFIKKEFGEAIVFIGITLDEIHRVKKSEVKYIKNSYPLIYNYKKPMNRNDCIEWLKSKGHPIPVRSACYFCPFHSDQYWLWLKTYKPDIFNRACEMDKKIRKYGHFKKKGYLHRSCRPLEKVKFDDTPNMFQEECEGFCGV